jgi:hypothetical protein
LTLPEWRISVLSLGAAVLIAVGSQEREVCGLEYKFQGKPSGKAGIQIAAET